MPWDLFHYWIFIFWKSEVSHVRTRVIRNSLEQKVGSKVNWEQDDLQKFDNNFDDLYFFRTRSVNYRYWPYKLYGPYHINYMDHIRWWFWLKMEFRNWNDWRLGRKLYRYTRTQVMISTHFFEYWKITHLTKFNWV